MGHPEGKDNRSSGLSWVVPLSTRLISSIEQRVYPIQDELLGSVDHLLDSDLSLLRLAVGLHPDPLGLAHVFKRHPYTNPRSFREDFNGAVSRGWLQIVGEGIYHPTQVGMALHQRLLAAQSAAYQQMPALPQNN